MNRGILEHVWKSYVIVAVLFIYSNAAFAFDDIESVRQKMSKGDIITNTDSIDFLFEIDRGKSLNKSILFDTISYRVNDFDSICCLASCYVIKDSLEDFVIPGFVEIDGKSFKVDGLYIGEASYYCNIVQPLHVNVSNINNEKPFVKLRTMYIPNTVKYICGLNYCLSLETITIEQSPDSCYESFDDYDLFCAYCPSLKNIILPEGIKGLPDESFSGCGNLKEVVLPQSLELIEDDCFIGCTQLERINIPNNVCKIGENAFKDCSNLKEIILPQSLEAIERNCFNGCTNLEKVYIPANVKEIDNTAFVNCPNLKEIIIDSNNPYYDSRDNCNAIIDSRTNTLIRACSTSTIPEGVQIIAEYAFYDCNVQSLVIPGSVTTICDFAFENSSLSELNIPASVDSIGMAICAVCRSLNKITVDKKNKKYDSRKGCNAIIRTADNTLITSSNNTYIPNGVECIDYGAFFGSGITGIYIPQSVMTVGSQAFASCTSLSQITVDKRNKVFYSENNCLIKGKTLVAGCSKSVIPSDITTIGAFAFRHIPLHWKLDIPDNITEIQSHAFWDCNTIEYLILPDSLTLFGDYAFANCNTLNSVVINSVDKFGKGTFYACNKLYNVSFTSPIDSLGDYAFYNCTNLESIVLPNGMTCIGEYAFYRCLNLEYITFPSTLEEIEGAAFKDCISLKSVYLPKGLKRMNYSQTFSSCNSLTEVELPDSLMLNPSLRWGAFKDCKNLETIKIPLSKFQEGIYSQAFQGCTRLNKVILK